MPAELDYLDTPAIHQKLIVKHKLWVKHNIIMIIANYECECYPEKFVDHFSFSLILSVNRGKPPLRLLMIPLDKSIPGKDIGFLDLIDAFRRLKSSKLCNFRRLK